MTSDDRSASGAGHLDLSRAEGVIVGDHARMYATFALPPSEVVWPVRVGPVVAVADGFQHRGAGSPLDPPPGAETVVLTEVLAGMGGVGKSQLAAELADRLWRGGRLDLLVWVSARDRSAILSGYAQAAQAVGISGEADAEQAAPRLLSWLAVTTKRWLVVLDDLGQPGELRTLWPPDTPTGATVVTTRRRDAALSGRGRRLVDIGLFTAAEAHAYLSRKLADHPRLADDIAGVAEDLGHLPLALAQATAFMIDRRVSCSEYRRRFADHHRHLGQLVPEPTALPDDHLNTVAVTWTFSIEAANRLEPAGLARPVLELCAVLDSNGIPAQVLTTPAACGLLDGAHPEQVSDAVAALHRLSLLDYSDDAERPTIRVHALVQRAVRESLSAQRLGLVVTAAADALSQGWPQTDHELGHSQVLRANTAVLAGIHPDRLWNTDTGAHPVLLRAGRSLGEVGQVHAAAAYFDALYRSALHHLGPDHPGALSVRGSLAFWRGEAGDPTGAVAALTELLDEYLRLLGPDHPATLNARGNLAFWRGEAGDPTGAANAFALLLDQYLRLLGPDHPAALNTRGNLAFWRGESGNPDRAATAYTRLLDDRVRLLGPDHPDTLKTRGNLARWQGRAGDPAGAASASGHLLDDCRRVLGPDHPDTLSVRHNLAGWLGEAGDPAAAAAAYAELLDDRLRVLGPDHPGTLTTRGALAYWQGESGDPAKAATAYAALLNDYRRVLGPDHPDTLNARSNLAYWQGESGDPASAATAYAELLKDYGRVLGPNHPETRNTHRYLARWEGSS
jgi:hypothetical protein